LSQCNEDWEHSFGVKIDTLDNPGWQVTIDLRATEWEELVVPRQLVERSEHDWLQTEVTGQKFIGCGGPGNLEEIIAAFLETVAAAYLTA
jgi:hypothetical protein